MSDDLRGLSERVELANSLAADIVKLCTKTELKPAADVVPALSSAAHRIFKVLHEEGILHYERSLSVFLRNLHDHLEITPLKGADEDDISPTKH